MPITSKIRYRVDLPGEKDQWIEVRMPSMAILERASRARSRKAIELVGALGDIKLLGQVAQPEQPTQRDVLDDYDWEVLLGECIISWSYSEPLTLVSELDEATVRLLVAVLLPVPEKETERKKG